MKTIERPPKTLGLHHLALKVEQLDECLNFYHTILGMAIEWQPDDDNIYLTHGSDNLALHRVNHTIEREHTALDHLGFILGSAEQVEAWYAYLQAHHVPMLSEVKHHRDGAVSFYCHDPDKNAVQFIYHPPIVAQK